MLGHCTSPSSLRFKPDHDGLRAGRYRSFTTNSQVVGMAFDAGSEWLVEAARCQLLCDQGLADQGDPFSGDRRLDGMPFVGKSQLARW